MTFAAPPAVEIVNPRFTPGRYRAVMFDFDGTLSLIRRNWQGVMIPMMLEALRGTGTAESDDELLAVVEDFVFRLTGRQTIYQMFRLVEEVQKRGGVPRDPLDYKHVYHEQLGAQVGRRMTALQSGEIGPDDLTVPGSRDLLQSLATLDMPMYLASGTDLPYVKEEVAALRLDHYFGPRVYGALDDYKKFSKKIVVEQILGETGDGQLLSFGDGFVEIEETKRVGGIAVGVASNEETRQGVNESKRRRLIEAGADIIVPDYTSLRDLVVVLGLGSANSQ